MILVQRRLESKRRLVASVMALTLASTLPPGTAQEQGRIRDAIAPRADYRDLDELLEKLPKVAPPAFDKSRVLWMGALPLACLDRLQSRTAGRGGRAGAAAGDNAPAGPAGRGGVAPGRGDLRGARGAAGGDTTTADAAAGGAAAAGAAIAIDDPAGRGGGPGGGGGAGYFWVPSYRLVADHDRIRAFWGCTDWHSAVSSTWVLVRLLKSFPDSGLEDLVREKLNAHLGKSNLEGELAFFRAAAAAINPIPSANQTGLFERPYGFAWLLKLQSELRTWPDSHAKRWTANLAPLTAWIADNLATYMVTLPRPVRTGTQANTALSLTLALDYAEAAHDIALRARLVSAARKFYTQDKACDTQGEAAAAETAGRGGGRGGAGRSAGAENAARGGAAVNDLSAATPAVGAGRGAGPSAGDDSPD